MGNIGLILGAMRNFHPNAQIPVINMLKYQRKVLAEPYGFAKLPEIFSEKKMTGMIERSLIDPKTSIRDIIVDLLKKFTPKFDRTKYEIVKQQVENLVNSKYREARINSLSIDFNRKKDELIKLFQHDYYVNNLVAEIQLAKTPQELEQIIQRSHKTYDNSFVEKMLNKYTDMPPDSIIYLEKYNHITAYNDFYLNLLKTINNKNPDKAVLEIEQILKNDFGIEFASLDNIIDAQNILETVKIAKKSGVPIPQNIIISPFALNRGQNLRHLNGTQSVILKSNRESFNLESINSIKDSDLKTVKYIKRLITELKHKSTASPYHTGMHEFIHSERTINDNITKAEIDSRFDNIVERLSTYAFDNRKKNPEEVRVELRTKQVLDYLNSEEENLLNMIS